MLISLTFPFESQPQVEPILSAGFLAATDDRPGAFASPGRLASYAGPARAADSAEWLQSPNGYVDPTRCSPWRVTR